MAYVANTKVAGWNPARDFNRAGLIASAITDGEGLVVVNSSTAGYFEMPSARTDMPAGVMQIDAPNATSANPTPLSIVTRGIAKVEIASAITNGNPVAIANTSGQVQVAYPGDWLVGIARQTGATLGDKIEVELMIGQRYVSNDQTAVTGASHTVAKTDYIIWCTYTATGTVTVTLPTAQVQAGRSLYIVDKSDASANNITIATEGSETVDGSATGTINTQYGHLHLVSDGTNWYSL